MILGSLLGGVLTQAFGWGAVFYVNVPLAAAAALLARPILGSDRRAADASGRRFDMAGAITGTAGTTLLVFALVQGPEAGWTTWSVLSAATAGLLLLTAFVGIERGSADPLLPLGLLRGRDLGTGMVVTFLYMATFGCLLYFLTVYFQTVLGYDALHTGLAFLLPMVAIVAGAQLAGALATRWGPRPTMITGLLTGLVGTVLTAATLTADSSYLTLIPGLMILGLGQGAGYTLMFGAATARTAPHQQGIASGAASTTQQVGGAVGLAVLVAVYEAATPAATGLAHTAAATDGLHVAFFTAAAGIAVTALVALGFSPSRDKVTPEVDRTEVDTPTAIRTTHQEFDHDHLRLASSRPPRPGATPRRQRLQPSCQAVEPGRRAAPRGVGRGRRCR